MMIIKHEKVRGVVIIMRKRIYQNSIMCKKCGGVLTSKYRHDFKRCSCGTVAIDGGHDYLIQITADAPHWGGLSGATPSEAISWKKIKPNELEKNVVVYCDVTIAAPLLFFYILSRKYKKKYIKTKLWRYCG